VQDHVEHQGSAGSSGTLRRWTQVETSGSSEAQGSSGLARCQRVIRIMEVQDQVGLIRKCWTGAEHQGSAGSSGTSGSSGRAGSSGLTGANGLPVI
jgi:hypothetical protein